MQGGCPSRCGAVTRRPPANCTVTFVTVCLYATLGPHQFHQAMCTTARRPGARLLTGLPGYGLSTSARSSTFSCDPPRVRRTVGRPLGTEQVPAPLLVIVKKLNRCPAAPSQGAQTESCELRQRGPPPAGGPLATTPRAPPPRVDA